MSRCADGKIKILMVVGHYLPGFRSGGILRSVENTINRLNDEFEFYVVTRDHDIGEKSPYPDIKRNEWQVLGHANVRYLSVKECSYRKLCAVINGAPQDLIHLNSFFDPLTVKVLFARRLGHIAITPLILSPRGEFAWASLRIKFFKKLIYMLVSKSLLFFRNITWHASSEHEKNDITKMMRIDPSRIQIAKDLSTMVGGESLSARREQKPGIPGSLRVIFLSRISREKNLDYAIKVLSQCKSQIVFDIYGTIEDGRYWRKCRRLLEAVPGNLTVSYRGPLDPGAVVRTFSEYDILLFPSGGENYGHVIAESLSAGTPVLISRNTPWRDLQRKNFGWDVDLTHPEAFVQILEAMASMTVDQRAIKRSGIVRDFRDSIRVAGDAERNRQLYTGAVAMINRTK